MSAILPQVVPVPPARMWRRFWRRVDTAYGPMIVNRLDQYIGWSLMAYGEYGGEEVEFLRSLVEPGDVVIDVGANIGALTIPLADKVGPTGQVHAFEPQPEVFTLLVENVHLANQDITAYHAALGRAEGTIVVPPIDYEKVGNFGGVALQPAGAGTEVPMLTLDQLALPRVTLIKVDVEGMETEVLLGAQETIRRCRPLLYVEADRMEKIEELMLTIHTLGYSWTRHTPHLFRANNCAGNRLNIFGQVASFNLLCRPQ